MRELTERQRRLLGLIVKEYVETAAPVGSQVLVRKGALNVSPATIRNEMMELEETGYIYQPHTSAGRVPTDAGYRLFIGDMLEESELDSSEQRTILHQFHQVELEMEQWTQLAASILVHMANNAAIVSAPSAPQCRLKHLELVPVQEKLALLVLVLDEGHVRQKLVAVADNLAEDELGTTARKLTAHYRGLSASEIKDKLVPNHSSFEGEVRDAVVHTMRQVDASSFTEVIFDGLVMMLRQPEFFGTEKIHLILEALQQRDVVATIAPEIVHSEGVRVIIGEEFKSPSLRECTVVISRYGSTDRAAGVLGVLGPKRMHYERAIPAVRYVSRVMTGLLQELYS